MAHPNGGCSGIPNQQGHARRLGDRAEAAQVEMGRACSKANRWKVVDACLTLATEQRRADPRQASDEMGRRFREVCSEQKRKVGGVG